MGSEKAVERPKGNGRDLVGFWLLGFINNVSYVIMIAGAKEISSGAVGLVYFVDIFPSLLVKTTGPFWFHWFPYRLRILFCSVLMFLSFCTVALSRHNLSCELAGVALSGFQSGLGEASVLALSCFYTNPSSCLASWSSGTGFAGVGGFLWLTLFHNIMHFQFRTTLLVANIFPVLFSIVFFFILDTPWIDKQRSHTINTRNDMDHEIQPLHLASTLPYTTTLSTKDRIRVIFSLWPYMVPLTLVYFAEYCMQTGVWSSIGFPVTNKHARNLFYTYSGTAYQIGVFVSRSSGFFFRVSRIRLFFMAFSQVFLLIFFILISSTHFWYNWWLLILCIVVGLLGGGVYVNAFMLIEKEVDVHLTEFSLSAASVADTLGIMFADVTGLFLQGCLYSLNSISGARFIVKC